MEEGDIRIAVRPDGGDKYYVTADMRDIRVWERLNSRNTLRRLQTDTVSDDHYLLAHIALRRQRGMSSVPSLAEFMESNVVIAVPEEVPQLRRSELVAVIDKVMGHPGLTPELLADAVMDLLAELPGRPPDPTRPDPSPG